MIALDTNILVHAHQLESDLHHEAKRVVRALAESPAPWAICFHCLVEFYAVVTHSKLWRLPSTPRQAMDQIAAWRESTTLRLLSDNEASLDALSRLVQSAKINGGQVHDARIAACCLTFGVRELWTVDRDFSRFPKLTTRNPLV